MGEGHYQCLVVLARTKNISRQGSYLHGGTTSNRVVYPGQSFTSHSSVWEIEFSHVDFIHEKSVLCGTLVTGQKVARYIDPVQVTMVTIGS